MIEGVRDAAVGDLVEIIKAYKRKGTIPQVMIDVDILQTAPGRGGGGHRRGY